jgi:hypothetical protein
MSGDSRKNPTEQQAAAQATKPLFFVINDFLYWQAKSGEELRLNLDFPQSVLQKVMDEDLDERGQFLAVLEMLGDKATVAKVQKMGALEMMRLVTVFFAEFEKGVQAPLGKSESSSDS